MEIRPCASHEIEAVLELWRRADAAPSVSDDEAGVGTLLGRDPQALLVAVDDGVLIGTLIAGFDGWRGTLARLAVDPAHRRLGVATALLAAGEDRLRRLGARRSSAIVIQSHEDAAGFWNAVGYAQDERVGRFVKDLP
ncbi:MAG TPA: GNAT family N-acetyltransferase [Gaiellaceae bacterium]|jgi:ribosomal protein S18 acetylase RimI-like enzyme